MRRLQLQRVSLAGELLRISFAGRILELPQLPQKHFALASEIARFHGMNSAGPRRAPWTSEQTPDENRAEDETSRQDGQRRDPIDGGFGVHDPAFGEKPCGQP